MIHPYSYYPGRAAKLWPDKIALIEGENHITYSELDNRISQVANTLLGFGIKKGERVAVVHQNNIPFVISICGAARAGAVFVPLLGVLTEQDHAFMISDSDSRVVISSGETTDERVMALKTQCQTVDTVVTHGDWDGTEKYEDILETSSTESPTIRGFEEDLAQIIYTSGTTGKSKGVMHSYSSTQAAMFAWVHLSNMTFDDVNLLSLPMSHFGARLMDSGWCVGTTGVIIPNPDTQLIIEAVQQHKVTNMTLIPTILTMILNHPEVDSYDLTSLRFIVYAASPASAALVRKATQKFGQTLHTGWGLSEAYVLNTLLSPQEHEEALRSAKWRLISCGREAINLEARIRIVNEQGNDVGPGEVGEACIRAPWQAVGYWKLPEMSAKTFVDGWLHTRDILKYDEDGYFYVMDRKDDLIISGGYNVYPREIEEVLYSHEAVLECAVVGVPDTKWGEAVTAEVVLKAGATVMEKELITLCKDKLARYKPPKSIRFVQSLPKTSVGKISKRNIKAKYWKDKDRQIGGVE